MSLGPQFLDELRARTSLSALIGRSVKLQRAGREWKACCPFHSEKTPSFTINDEKGFYHCFGCGAHGDAIRFLTDARGLPFIDAVKELADAAGLEVPAPDPQAAQRAERATGLYEVMDAASAWFQEQLAGLDGSSARDYIERRGLSADVVRRFALGFAPDSRARLKGALHRFGDKALIETGLLIEPEGEKDPYDRFRGRLMIPIRDQRGRVIAFGGRILGAGEPKYLNSPETPLFDKGRTLYNLDRAGPASRETRRVVVVEGYMDVIALDQAGIEDVVAPLGTAVTEGQLERLWRLSDTPVLCFDGDAAGQKAALRAALRALPKVGPGRSLAFVTLPAGTDPDDLVRQCGAKALQSLFEEAEPLVDRLWNHELGAEPRTTPEQRAGLKRRLLDHVSSIGDPDVRDQYRHELLTRFDAATRPRREAWVPREQWVRNSRSSEPRFRRGPLASSGPQARRVGLGDLAAETGRALVQGLLLFPDQIAANAEAIAALPIADESLARLREILLDAAITHGELDQDGLNTILARSGASDLAEKLRQTRGLAFSFTRRDADPERARRDLVLVIETLAAQPGLFAALEEATTRLKEDGDEAAFREQQRLRTARDEADRQLATLIEGDAGA